MWKPIVPRVSKFFIEFNSFPKEIESFLDRNIAKVNISDFWQQKRNFHGQMRRSVPKSEWVRCDKKYRISDLFISITWDHDVIVSKLIGRDKKRYLKYFHWVT